MQYLLDTNVWVDYFNGQYPRVVRRIQGEAPTDLYLSSIVLAELRYGADKSRKKVANHAKLDMLQGEVQCLDFDRQAASALGRIRAGLEREGRIIGAYDMLIAAQALSRQLVLVTDNVGEFSRVEGLDVENWR
ncbi:MAG: type II toxin-antitoxin system VapC family toxin [bacterium]|nr:type II toxin-antitoxin system VapC family toxin [bacterium]